MSSTRKLAVVWMGLMLATCSVAASPVPGLSSAQPRRMPTPLLAESPAPVSYATADVSPQPSVLSAWEPWDEGLPSFAQVMALEAAPEDPGTLYASVSTGPAIWRSTDGGATWEQADQIEGPPAGSQPVFALCWDGRRQGWWAGTSRGLYYRPSDSSTWQSVPGLGGAILDVHLDEAGSVYAIQSEAGLHRQNPDGTWECLRQEPRGLVVATAHMGQSIYLGTAGNGLWVSHDGGDRWRRASELRDAYISDLLVSDQAGLWIYARAGNQAYRSEDLGRTWQPVPGLDDAVYSLALAPDGSVYAGLEGQIACSKDAGQTWGLSSHGLPPRAAVLEILAVGPPGGVYALYAAAADGVYRSTDRGRTWQRHQEGFGGAEVEALGWDVAGGLIAATPSGLFQRLPGESQWKVVGQAFRYEPFYGLSREPVGRTLYAGMEQGLLRNSDGGASWELVESDLSPHAVHGVVVDPDDPEHLYIRLAFERVYESHDGGRTWTALWEGMQTHHVVLSLALSSSGVLWAGTQDGLFYWDLDVGQWQREPLPLPHQSVFAIAFDPEGESQYVGATLGLWCRSGRSQWCRCAAETIRHTATALAVLPGGHLYAGTRYAGLFRSCDAGETWHAIPGIPAGSTVKALLADSQGKAIYVATDQGLFRGEDWACPAPEPPGTDTCWRCFRGWLVRGRQLLRIQEYPQVRPLPAVHTLRADDAILRQAKEIGFRAIVQVFSWEEIEPTRGEWHWEYPDFLVQAAEFYGLDLIVRLDQPPGWAVNASPGSLDAAFDTRAYLGYVKAVVQRYQSRIRAYIIWNEPNLAREWAATPDPEAYARLLKASYLMVKEADPFALVVSAGLAPTNEQSEQAMDDRVFLQGMYEAGVRSHFDALGAHPYGFAYPPDDPYGNHGGLNMNRLLDLRAIMEANQDDSTPVWVTELGWTTHGTGEKAWHTVTPEEQADYLVRAWWWMRDEFPWLEVFTVWNLGSGLAHDDEKAGYSLLSPDGTPRPAGQALRSAFTSAAPEQARLGSRDLSDMLVPTVSSIAILARDEEVHLGDSE